jgi:hypothetical protein
MDLAAYRIWLKFRAIFSGFFCAIAHGQTKNRERPIFVVTLGALTMLSNAAQAGCPGIDTGKKSKQP